VWFFQVKWISESESWHPHLHCVLDAEYLPHKTLKAIWLEITGDSSIVDIKAVRDPQKVAEYVARYAARPCKLKDLEPEQRIEVVQALHGRRLCGKWGDTEDLQLSVKSVDADSDYVTICDYSKLSDLCKISEFAVSIRYAYSTGEPVQFVHSKDNIQELLDEMWAKTRPPPDVPMIDPQLELWADDTAPSNCYSGIALYI
jgi:hypothetical protein